MVLTEYFRVDYEQNFRNSQGPMPPGFGRGFYFEPEMFWPLPDFLTEEGLQHLRTKATFLLESSGIRKDFEMAQSGGTKRALKVVPGTVISEDVEIMELYKDPGLLDFIVEITNSDIEPYPDPLENVVITSLEGDGDTHGRHLDVPPFALIMCLEAPEADDPDARLDVIDADGEVWQTIIGTNDGAGALSFTNVHGDPQIHVMSPGDAYLLRSDLLPHEVLPLSDPSSRRVILNFTYGIKEMNYEEDGSAEVLFAQ